MYRVSHSPFLAAQIGRNFVDDCRNALRVVIGESPQSMARSMYQATPCRIKWVHQRNEHVAGIQRVGDEITPTANTEELMGIRPTSHVNGYRTLVGRQRFQFLPSQFVEARASKALCSLEQCRKLQRQVVL